MGRAIADIHVSTEIKVIPWHPGEHTEQAADRRGEIMTEVVLGMGMLGCSTSR